MPAYPWGSVGFGVSVPELEIVVEELSPRSGTVRWGLSLCSQDHPVFQGAVSQRYLSGLEVGCPVQACSLEVFSGHIQALEEGVSSRASVLEGKRGSKDGSLGGYISCLLQMTSH